MGKRGSVEKPTNNITNATEISNESCTDEREGTYVLTNNFAQDFHELAKRAGYPELRVVARPKRPSVKKLHSAGLECTAPPPPAGKSDKKDDKKDDKSDARTTSQLTNGSEQDRAPATFCLKEKFEYLKPTVQVQWEDEGVKSMAKELYIRGWQIDNRIMDIFNLTLPTQDKLAKIDFSNTALTDSLLEVLANIIKQLPLLRNLSLDGNPLYLQRYGMFLGEDSTLQNVSLRNCYVNDMGANHIGRALMSNKSLLTLNLCFNKISCEGAASIANALRTNRTLLSLDLGSNLISDAGAAKFAETISRFALNHDETITRRLLLSKKAAEEPSPSPARSVNHGTVKGDNRPPSVRSGSHLGKDQKKEKQKGKKAENKKISVDDRLPKKASITDATKDAKKGKKSSMAKVEKKGFGGISDQDTSDAMEFPNPLLEPVEEVQGDFYISGNRALINLNLSANKIGDSGMKSLLDAVQYQSQLAVAHSRTGIGIGLLRLSLKRNNVSDDSMVFQNLQDLMIARDPFFKPDNASHDDIGSIKEME